MKAVEFFVPGDPVGRDTGQTREGGHYTTREGKAWRRIIAGYALACPDRPTGEPFLGAVTITAIFVLQRPATHFLPSGELSAAGRRFPRPTGSADLDNMCKPLLDSLKKVGWYRDDAQVVGLLLEKRWCSRETGPGVHVTIRFDDSAEGPGPAPDAHSSPRARRQLADGVEDAETRTGPQIALEGVAP